MVRPLHPKERQVYSRRAFLQRAAAAGIALPSMAAILAACGSGAESSVATSAGSGGGGDQYGTGGITGAAYPLARPDAPVTWNVDEAELIADDLPAEENATVKLLRWPYYLAPSVIKSFEKKYKCTVEQTEFSDMDKGLAKINSGQGDFDLLVGMNVWAVGRSIAAGLVRPLNLSYIPNLAANNWSTFQSPFYDVESRYSVPYSVWSTGIFWNNQEITDDIAGMANPYDIFWNGAPVDKTHLLANAQDVLSMSMFRDGLTDVNVTDAATIIGCQGCDGRGRECDERGLRPRGLHRRPEGPGVPAPVLVGQRERRVRVRRPQRPDPGQALLRVAGRVGRARQRGQRRADRVEAAARTPCSATCC